MRLNKFLAENLGLSRREADDAIAAGKVKIDDRTAVLGDRIDNNSKVCYNGSIVPVSGHTYVAFNKPVGYVCSRKRQGDAETIYVLLPEKYQNLKTVGRLDKDSSGLILLTNDGDFAFQMTHPKFVKTKIYEVELDHDLEPLHQQMIADFGIQLKDGYSRLGLERIGNAGTERNGAEQSGAKRSGVSGTGGSGEGGSQNAGRQHWRVTMNEGRNRQIRRTFGALGYTVTGLHRTDFGKYHLDGLAPGEVIEIEK